MSSKECKPKDWLIVLLTIGVFNYFVWSYLGGLVYDKIKSAVVEFKQDNQF
jgi:hypothetical protein